ncbi:hypothetical protein EPO14_00335 [Patescibacteria group bacterium]|nr:MAG: hypothetical protein EPO14_00335 [Patescibacteria group bacterium]
MKKTKNSHDYAVIMAGGSGTRLWPLSRKNKPKQFQRFVGEKTLFQLMYKQLLLSFAPEKIFVQIPAEYLSYIQEQEPDIAKKNIIIEPEARDTAPAFAFAAAVIYAKDKDATVGIFNSDHLIDTPKIFHDSVALGFDAARQFPEDIVMIGVRPLSPHTGLGYIRFNDAKPIKGFRAPLYRVESFVEKPDTKHALKFIASGRYLWNTGYKITNAKNLLEMLKKSKKEYKENIHLLVGALADKSKSAGVYFKKLSKQSFEYLITEKTARLIVIPSSVDWSDIGDWEAVHSILTQKRKKGLHTAGKVVEHESKNTLLISTHRPIVAIGVDNLIVVETEDAVLIMSKNRSQDIKPTLQRLLENEPHLS